VVNIDVVPLVDLTVIVQTEGQDTKKVKDIPISVSAREGTVETETDGKAVFTKVPVGAVTIKATLTEPLKASYRIQAPEKSIQLLADGKNEVIIEVVEKGILPVKVVIKDQRSKVVPKSLVTLVPKKGGTARPTEEVNDQGKEEIDNIPVGDYTIQAKPPRGKEKEFCAVAAVDVSVKKGKNPEKTLELDELLLKLTQLDDHFAPSHEEIEYEYEIKGLKEKKVELIVEGSNYSKNPIFKQELTSQQKENGKRKLKWDGKANCSDGDLKDQFIHPLYAPYTLKLVCNDPAVEDKKEFKVLYHSIELDFGTHTFSPHAFDDRST